MNIQNTSPKNTDRYLTQSSKAFIVLSIAFLLAIAAPMRADDTDKPVFVNLAGQTLPNGNPAGADGNIHKVTTPALQILRTSVLSAKGTILLLDGGEYESLAIGDEGTEAASFLLGQGYDVAILQYHVAAGAATRNLALTDALAAFRLLKTNILGLHGGRLGILGFGSGAHLAARTVIKLDSNEQPTDLLLIAPHYFDETNTGTVFQAIMPPVHPTARLFAAIAANDNKLAVTSCSEYAKTWRGFDGYASLQLLTDSTANTHLASEPLATLLRDFLGTIPAVTSAEPNPATIPVAGYNKKRHADKLEIVAKEKFDLIMIGNSITNNFEKPAYQPVWNQFFAPRHAVNLGFSGYRTENLLWNIENGELDGQSPKVVVLEIGTNNIDEKHYPTRHTAAQLAGGIEAIVKRMREKMPDAKIVLLRCFPGCYGGPNPTSHRLILARASDIVSKLADGKHIFYCDVNHVFLNLDGSINHDRMPDWLHPSPAGAKAWAQAMEPLLSELMGDKSLDTAIVANTAIVPAAKLENDSYDWWARHAEVLRIKDSINPQVVLIGNSITHFWGGEPKLRYANGKLRKPNGPKSWEGLFASYRVLNLGFGWDRTQNVLWRLDHGELDGLHPRTVVIDIGTNNTSQTPNARINTAAEIVEGIRAVCLRVRSKTPDAQIILMAVFPREQSPDHPRRILINEINRQLEIFTKEQKLTFVNIAPGMLAPDGTLLPDITRDFCHPTDKGYQVWAEAIREYITAP
jgi:lysophospholipase L1-like esterase